MAALFMATFTGPNSETFRAFGRSESAARGALAEGWSTHARTRGATLNYLGRHGAEVAIAKLEAGHVYRDRERIR